MYANYTDTYKHRSYIVCICLYNVRISQGKKCSYNNHLVRIVSIICIYSYMSVFLGVRTCMYAYVLFVYVCISCIGCIIGIYGICMYMYVFARIERIVCRTCIFSICLYYWYVSYTRITCICTYMSVVFVFLV